MVFLVAMMLLVVFLVLLVLAGVFVLLFLLLTFLGLSLLMQSRTFKIFSLTCLNRPNGPDEASPASERMGRLLPGPVHPTGHRLPGPPTGPGFAGPSGRDSYFSSLLYSHLKPLVRRKAWTSSMWQ